MKSGSGMSAFLESSLEIRLYLKGKDQKPVNEKAAEYLKSLNRYISFESAEIVQDDDVHVVVLDTTQTTALNAWGTTEKGILKIAVEHLVEYPDLYYIGASVIYQAVFGSISENTGENAVRELCEAKIIENKTPFAQDIPGGRLYLLDYPIMSDLGTPDFRPKILYLALCEARSEEKLNSYLYNYSFFSRDLVFLKAHQNVHKFRVESSRDNLDITLKQIDKDIQALFTKEDVLDEITKKGLNSLSSSLSQLLKFYIQVNSTATSMVQQKTNYQHSFDAEPSTIAEGQVWNFLRERINTLNEELEIQISECQVVMRATQQAVGMVQTRINQADEAQEREQEKRLRRRDELLAYLGVAIALPELINYDLVEKLLTSWKIHLLPGGYFAIQLFLIGIIGFFIVDFIKRSSLHSPK